MGTPVVSFRFFLLISGLFTVSAALLFVARPAAASTVSYDRDGDGLIEISNLAQLNAIRWDRDGDGAVDSGTNRTAYTAAFPNAAASMGCATDSEDADDNDCTGYELAADVDFDTDGNGDVDSADPYWNSGAGWAPISGFAATFEGNFNTVSGLYIDRAAERSVGLFSEISAGAEIRNVGLNGISVTGGRNSGGLVGTNSGTISASYATGSVTGGRNSGGLVGTNSGTVSVSYATCRVRTSGPSGGAGGLVGLNWRGAIIASYATGRVRSSGSSSKAGGLVGDNWTATSTIIASYAIGWVRSSGSSSSSGGLVGSNSGTITASYWDTATSGQSTSAGGVGKTTAELKSPTGYTGIYADWNLDLDDDGTRDFPWDFGTSSVYPVLRVPSRPVQSPARTVSYDSDGDGLIEISNLAQLDAVRWDLNGDGAVDSGTNRGAYTAAFPNAAAGMGCAAVDHDGHSSTPDVPVCTGYELNCGLDFDTDGDGEVDAADAYWNRRSGWEPIGSAGTGNEFIATFDGNGHTISHLYISRSSSRIGLFGVVGNGGLVRNLGLLDVDVNGSSRGVIVGGLAGKNAGIITGSHVTGSVSSTGDGSSEVGGLVGRNGGPGDSGSSIAASYASASVTGPSSSFRSRVGGLAGYNYGSIRASYASGTVTGTGNQSYVGGLVGLHNGGSVAVCYATGSVTGKTNVGGLVGQNDTSIWASYATGAVTGDDYVGGLVGYNQSGSIRAGYATGWVTSAGSDVGGLVGRNQGSGVSNSYWNTTTSGRVSSAAGEGKTTVELQTPSGYTGIYATWNLDLDNADGDRDAATGGDDPWDFGTAQQFPALRADFDGDGTATWQEFGQQRPDASPTTETGPTDDATLKALGISPVDIEGFSADMLSYHIGVANDVSQVTVTPYPNDEGATVDIDGHSVSSRSGHAVSIAEGSNEITIMVTARDGTTTKEYTVTADRGSNAPFGWKVTEDFNDLALDSGVSPRGIWSSGTTMWVACATGNDNVGANLCRYSMSTKKRGADGFHTLGTWGNNSPMGIASDGTTMYVADVHDDKIFAYKMASYARDASKEINLLIAAGNTVPLGITIYIGGIYVADSSDGKIYAYQRHTKQRLAHLDNGNLRASGNNFPSGIWTDGQTMWVADRGNTPKIYAYIRGTGSREAEKDFNTLEAAGNTSPWGIWSDGTTMWVVDSGKNRIFSYNMPSSAAEAAATDFNGDGRTDFVDFFLFADAYGSTNAKFDLDGNGTVDFADFFKFVDAFGS